MKKFQSTIWYEKYRPKKISQLALPENYRSQFEKWIDEKDIPHLLFYGPAGSGKTTLAKILIKNCASAAKVLNASSRDRGVNTIKEKVVNFASSMRRHKSKLNIIFFDEANGLTADAQEALKNTIEKYQSNCRFIFATNEIYKITEPIHSRCMLFKFDSYPKKELLKHTKRILKKEKVEYKRDDLKFTINHFYPDVRSILNTLQLCSIDGTLNTKRVLDTFDRKKIKKYLKNGQIRNLRNLVMNASDLIWVYQYLFNEFIMKEFEGEERYEAALIVSDYLNRSKGHPDKELNLAGCFLEIINLMDIEIEWE